MRCACGRNTCEMQFTGRVNFGEVMPMARRVMARIAVDVPVAPDQAYPE